MLIKFNMDSYEFTFTGEVKDIEVLAKIRSKDLGIPTNFCCVDEAEQALKEAVDQAVEKAVKAKQGEADQRWRWYQEEKNKVDELTKKIKVLEEGNVCKFKT